MKAFLKIERCGEVFSVRSEKTEQGTISKRVVVLRPLCGGDAGRGGGSGRLYRRHHLRRTALPDARPQRANVSRHYIGEFRQVRE